MPQWHSDRGKRKITGGRSKAYRKKRLFESGRYIAETQAGEKDLRILGIPSNGCSARTLRILLSPERNGRKKLR
jgi:ribosomal protein S8E